MKNYLYSILSLTALSVAGLLLSGCNGDATVQTSDNEVETTTAMEEPATGCCGKCTTGKDPAGSAEGCCGKCGSAGTDEVDPLTASDCAQDCNACAEGESEKCICGDAPSTTASTTQAVSDEPKVNTMPEDRDIFHFLLEHHDQITRTVTVLDNGVKTVTESTDEAIASKIQEHVNSMHQRVENGRPLRMWDELYREIFKHADKIQMEIEPTERGIAVTETSDDEYVVKLIQAHAKVVSGFAKRGFDEARLNHQPPAKD